jgi:hypothetical protein
LGHPERSASQKREVEGPPNGVETQPADVGVRFAVVVIPPATIVIDCVDGETYCGRRDAVARNACARGAGTVIVIVVVADLRPRSHPELNRAQALLPQALFFK